jgi:hypothetical protein
VLFWFMNPCPRRPWESKRALYVRNVGEMRRFPVDPGCSAEATVNLMPIDLQSAR